LEVGLKDQAYVQECVPEILNLKREIYTKLAQFISDETIIASSTSTFLPSNLTDGIPRKSQFIVAHPVNPPYFVPLVEIVPAPWTASWVLDKGRSIITELGQTAVVFKKEVPGFALNRIQYAILNECWNLVEDGVLDAKDVDKVMSDGLGMRYAFLGPLETAHLNAEGFESYSDRYSESMYAVCKTFKGIPKLAGQQAKILADQLNSYSPLDKLAERRKWRDESLAKLSHLKKFNEYNQ